MVRVLKPFDRYATGERVTFRPEKEKELLRRGLVEKVKDKDPSEPQHRQTTVGDRK